jgi:hypothetical protein
MNALSQGTQGYQQMKGLFNQLNGNKAPKPLPTTQVSAPGSPLTPPSNLAKPNYNATIPNDLNATNNSVPGPTTTAPRGPWADGSGYASAEKYTGPWAPNYKPGATTGIGPWADGSGYANLAGSKYTGPWAPGQGPSTSAQTLGELPILKMPQINFQLTPPQMPFDPVAHVNSLNVGQATKNILLKSYGIDPKTGKHYPIDSTGKSIIPPEANQATGIIGKIKSFDWKGVATSPALRASSPRQGRRKQRRCS